MSDQKLLKQFADNLKMEFAVRAVTVLKNGQKYFGGSIDSAAIESYLALPCTTVYKGNGSKFVTRFNIGYDNFIIELISDKSDTFDGQEAEYIVSDIKRLIGKLGE